MKSLERIWQEYNRRLLAFIRKRVNDEDAEDILQEVFIKVHTHLESIKDEDKIEKWLYQITRNTINDYYRSKKGNDHIPEWLSEQSEELMEEESQELLSCFQPMVEHLPEKYKTAVQLSEFEGLTQVELAQHLNIGLSGAKSRVQRGRLMLKDLLLENCSFSTNTKSGSISCEPLTNHCNKC